MWPLVTYSDYFETVYTVMNQTHFQVAMFAFKTVLLYVSKLCIHGTYHVYIFYTCTVYVLMMFVAIQKNMYIYHNIMYVVYVYVCMVGVKKVYVCNCNYAVITTYCMLQLPVITHIRMYIYVH